MVDCGPGQFALWRELRDETASEIAGAIEKVCLEQGPVEGMSKNSTMFCSATLGDMLKKWNVLQFLRATYRPGWQWNRGEKSPKHKDSDGERKDITRADYVLVQ